MIDLFDVATQNFSDFEGDENNSKLFSIDLFVLSLIGLEYFNYDIILGITDNEPNLGLGYHGITRTSWIGANKFTLYEHLASHEIGHQFGLEDEYCSNPAGAADSRCNDGGPPFNGTDINYLDSNLACNPAEGGGCCEALINGFQFPLCEVSNYEGACCLGNQNPTGGVATMSFTDASLIWPGKRTHDTHSRSHLSTFSKLSCAGPGTPKPAMEINFFLYNNDTIINDTLRQLNATINAQYNSSSDYNFVVLDNQNITLINQSIDIDFGYNGPILFGYNYSSVTDKPVEFSYRFEYNPNMYEAKLYHNSNIIYSKILNFCNTNSICENTETYLSCPVDCPLNQTDNICINEDEGVCDPDCAFGTDVNCALDLINLTNLTQNGTQVIYELIVENFANLTMENIEWIVDTGEVIENSTIVFNLSANEDIFIFFENVYGGSGNYRVNATVKSGNFEDSEELNITL